MNITEFLEARIAEDESVVAYAEPHEMSGGYSYADVGGLSEVLTVGATRVLAECAAKRAIIELHDSLEDRNWQSGKDHDFLWCGSCGTLDDAPVPYPCETLQTLAAVYSDHPDYDPNWALADS